MSDCSARSIVGAARLPKNSSRNVSGQFMSPDRSPPPEFSQFSGLRHWKQRLILSLFVGIVMTAIPLLSGWAAVMSPSAGVAEPKRAWIQLVTIQGFVREFQREHNRLPTSISEIEGGVGTLRRDFNDPWGRPLKLAISDKEFLVTTYGRDGQPGGIGLDADLSTDNLSPPEANLTLQQYLFEIDSSSVWLSCALCGLLAAVLTWRESRPQNSPFRTWLTPVIRLTVWGVLSIYVGSVIAATHLVPNGH